MLFDLLRRGLYFDKDESGGGTEDSSGDDADKKKKEGSAEDQNAGDDKEKGKAKEEEKLFTQAQLDALIDDRLKRERKKAETAAELARKKAEADALEKNQEWQKLAEQRATELAALTQEKAELEPFREQAERYKAALDDQLKKVKERLPKYLLPLIEKMDPVEAMAYITEHAEEIGAKLETYGETPNGKEKKVSSDDVKEAQRASGSVITRNF
jgi:hypothetical protein